MKIETEFDVLDWVIVINNNKPANGRITKIEISIKDGYGSNPPIVDIKYFVGIKGWVGLFPAKQYKRNEIYKTKNEILESL